MLTTNEQNTLYKLIVAFIGEDQGIKNYKSGFNERTILVVEDMIKANINCNLAMKNLLSGLVSAGKLTTRGWLKKALASIGYGLKSSGPLKGAGCLVVTKSKWKMAIISSSI